VYNQNIGYIKMPKVKRHTAKEFIKLLENDGWYEVSQSGSHRKYKHDVKPGVVIIPMHGGNLKIGTQNNIMKQAGLKQR